MSETYLLFIPHSIEKSCTTLLFFLPPFSSSSFLQNFDFGLRHPLLLAHHPRHPPPSFSTRCVYPFHRHPSRSSDQLSLSFSLSISFFFCLSSHVPTRLFHVKKKKSEISPSKSRAADATRRHHSSRNWMEGTIFLLLLRDRGGEGIFIARLIKPCKFKFEASRIF